MKSNTEDRAYTGIDLGKFNILQFKAGVVPSEVTASREGNDLIFKILGVDSFRAVSFFATASGQGKDYFKTIQLVKFADGTTWDPDTILAKSAAISTNHAPIVASAIPDQSWTEGQAKQYVVASATFTDPDGQTLTYSASQSGGSALPSWLSFAPSTRTFTGTPPTGTADVTVRVTASDGALSVFDDFVLATPAAAASGPADVVNGVNIGDASGSFDAAYLLSGNSTVVGSVGSGDRDDLYRFVAPSSGTVNVALTGLSGDLDLYLAQRGLPLVRQEVGFFQLLEGLRNTLDFGQDCAPLGFGWMRGQHQLNGQLGQKRRHIVRR